MNNTFFIYLATRLSGIQAISVSIAVASGIALLVLILYRLIELDETYEYDKERNIKRIDINKKQRKTAKRFLFISLFFAVFTPDTKEAVMIYAGGKTLDYVQKDTSLQKIPYKATELILKKMDQYLNDSTILN
jgi:hypothetical protein